MGPAGQIQAGPSLSATGGGETPFWVGEALREEAASVPVPCVPRKSQPGWQQWASTRTRGGVDGEKHRGL